MHDFMRDDLGTVLFDIALLAREPGTQELLGFAPLLAQGWALLPTSQLNLPPSLQELRRHVLPASLWTTYDHNGVELIRRAFAQEEIR